MTGAALLALVRRLGPVALFAASIGAALFFRAQRDDALLTLRNERQAWTTSLDRADRAKAEQERSFAKRLESAAFSFADRLAARQPIILRSTNTVREYASTAAGRVICRGPDRVRDVDALDADLADRSTGASQRGADAVPADAAAPSGGR